MQPTNIVGSTQPESAPARGVRLPLSDTGIPCHDNLMSVNRNSILP